MDDLDKAAEDLEVPTRVERYMGLLPLLWLVLFGYAASIYSVAQESSGAKFWKPIYTSMEIGTLPYFTQIWQQWCEMVSNHVPFFGVVVMALVVLYLSQWSRTRNQIKIFKWVLTVALGMWVLFGVLGEFMPNITIIERINND